MSTGSDSRPAAWCGACVGPVLSQAVLEPCGAVSLCCSIAAMDPSSQQWKDRELLSTRTDLTHWLELAFHSLPGGTGQPAA